MKLLIKNMTGQPVSTPIGTLQPGSSLSHEVPEYKLEAVTSELAKLGSRISYSVGDLAAGRSITSPLTLYVETTGDDSNPGTQAKPYRTIQAALDSLKGVEIAAAVTIKVGAGEFDGFEVSGLRFSKPIDAILTINGATTDLYQGTATSTSNVGAFQYTVTDTTATWSVDQFRGKIASINGQLAVITSNTSDTLYIPYVVGGVPSNAGYTIYELESNIGGSGTTAVTISGCTDSLVRAGSVATRGTNKIVLQTLNLLNPGQSGVYTFTARDSIAAVNGCILTNNSSLITLFGQRSLITMYACYFESGYASSAVLTNFGGSSFPTATIIDGCYFRKSASTTLGTWFNSSGQIYIRNGIFEGGSTISNITAGTQWISSVINYIYCINVTTPITLSKGGILGCALKCVGATTGVSATDRSSCYLLIGSDIQATTGVSATKGGCVNIASAATITASTELSVDGATSTLAGMRALSPKVFPATPNAYGSYVYE